MLDAGKACSALTEVRTTPLDCPGNNRGDGYLGAIPAFCAVFFFPACAYFLAEASIDHDLHIYTTPAAE